MNLPIELLFVLGILSSVVVFILKFLFINKGKEVPAWVYSVALYVVSLGLALVFSPVQIPPFPPFGDLSSGLVALLAWLGELIPILSAIVGFATIIYQALLKRVLDGLGGAIRKLLSVKEDLLDDDDIV